MVTNVDKSLLRPPVQHDLGKPARPLQELDKLDMWRTGNQRYNRRPYPSARPKIFISETPRNKRRVAPKLNPFINDPAASPADSPLKPNLFGAFHFELPNPRPNGYGPDHVDLVPPSLESLARNPRFVRRPPETPKAAPANPPQTHEPGSAIPGAFPMPDGVEHGVHCNTNTGPQQAKIQTKQPRERKRRRDNDDSEIGRLKKAVRRKFGDDVLGEEEQLLLKQLDALHVNYNYRTHLFKYREAMERASNGDEERAQKFARRDVVVEKLVEMESEEEEKAKKRREMEEDERQRLEEARRREREKARKQKEIEEIERERLRRWVEELAERGRQQEQERLQREAREKEEAKRRAYEDMEARRRIQENIRKARELFSAGDAGSIRRQFEEYEGKWIELKDGRQLPPLCFNILPWPILGCIATQPSDITRQRVEEFVYHPLRSGMESKSRRDRVRMEMLKWHPDKFDAKVLGKVIDADQVAEGAGFVARYLTQLMEEETEKENRGY
ncbi:hypothetical protein PILCRDRAFT_824475 [Piloderma croceum F 1598]|uniref:Uncharacterized protein n=1 Tax=Piloderma croceum (strain F 1598) TaxID=765440 RepID=A0A0C3FEF5_PILCF|nr:hypothetical protein PILCRDRAFT_826616 [Piloderma croceum F 1598]KIM78256.1 hypothetical protein PILCRDRAFT_824475 [Piloderma croceum F 1598]